MMTIIFLQDFAHSALLQSAAAIKTHVKNHPLAYSTAGLIVTSAIIRHLHNKGLFEHLWYAKGKKAISQKKLKNLVDEYQKLYAEYTAMQAEHANLEKDYKQKHEELLLLNQKHEAIIMQENMESVSEKDLFEYHKAFYLLTESLKKNARARDDCLNNLTRTRINRDAFINFVIYHYGQHTLHRMKQSAGLIF